MFLVYAMIPWFLILLFSNKNYFWTFIVILSSAALNIIIIDVLQISSISFVKEVGLLLKLDGFTALTLTFLFIKDKVAFKMCALLTFAVLCHTMLIYDITVHSSFVSNLFNAWYEELILTVGILQMAIAHDGITNALGNIWRHLQRIDFYCWCYSKSFLAHKNSERGS